MEWIKMRGALLEHPKVVAIARKLRENPSFSEWLFGPAAPPVVCASFPSGAVDLGDVGSAAELLRGRLRPAPASDVTVLLLRVTHAASRYVTVSALLRLWSSARDHGHFVGDDLVLEHSTMADMDEMAGLPGIAAEMMEVGWLTNGRGITLPNFKEFNVPQSGAERQSEYRKRHGIEPGKDRDEKVTRSTSHRVTRVEKNRGDSSAPTLTGSRPGTGSEVLPSSGKPETTATPARAADKTSLQIACGETWRRYCDAYERRWGAIPARSAAANGHIKGFCQRVPLAEGPAIAAFYCEHKRGLYVSAHHDLALLHRDAAGLRTEWLTANPQTDHEARQADRTAATGSAFASMIAEAQERERKANA